MKCILCKSESNKTKSLDKNYIIECLKKYYNEIVILPDIVEHSYDIYKCSNCELEFAQPLVAGNTKFYKWITSHADYYPIFRWEYNKVLTEIVESKFIKILDVGCGNGNFFKYIKHNNIETTLFGVDTNENSVNQCIEAGFTNTFKTSIEEFDVLHKFDCIVSFHCLEHVIDPVSFVKSMNDHLLPNGSLFLSLPLSPMHFEHSWFDPLNHPPHHITRWSIKSLIELAKQFGFDYKYSISDSLSIFKRTQNTVYLFKNKSNKPWIGPYLYLYILDFIQQLKRKKINGGIAGDIILFNFIKKE